MTTRWPRAERPTPITTRSRVVLEIASELAARRDQPYTQAKVLMQTQGAGDWPLCLFGSSTIEGVDAIIKGEAQLAIINPAAALDMAYRGESPFTSPQPVRVIGVIPSPDQVAFVVRSETGLTYIEDIAAERTPLKLSLRAQGDHWLQFMLNHILEAAGFSLGELESWGGTYAREGLLPYPNGPKFAALVGGEINAIFDEATDVWCAEALEAGMTILKIKEDTARKLETRGYRRAWLKKETFPLLQEDLLTLDFSGWPIFVHAEAADELVTQICEALEARKDNIPWQGGKFLPTDQICIDTPDTPQHVPLHPAAERFWQQCGYMK